MRSPSYYSCTDGAADEMGGIDGWMRSESKTGKREKWHKSTCLTVYTSGGRNGDLPRETLNIYCSAGWLENFLPTSNSSARKMAEEPPVKY